MTCLQTTSCQHELTSNPLGCTHTKSEARDYMRRTLSDEYFGRFSEKKHVWALGKYRSGRVTTSTVPVNVACAGVATATATPSTVKPAGTEPSTVDGRRTNDRLADRMGLMPPRADDGRRRAVVGKPSTALPPPAPAPLPPASPSLPSPLLPPPGPWLAEAPPPLLPPPTPLTPPFSRERLGGRATAVAAAWPCAGG